MNPAPPAAGGSAPEPTPPWRRRFAWLLGLGPFFFLSYGFANWWAAHLADPGVLAFAWERRIPFLPWTIVPYWSIDLLYGLAFLLCRDRRQCDVLGRRLLSVQLVSVACFLLFPLRFSFERPDTDGLFGTLFDILMGFDRPYNQAPSLHIGLLLVLWVRYADSARGGPAWLRGLVHGWALLIGVSVLTTWQHHFIDVPTGLLAGALCLWLWPDRGPSPLAAWRQQAAPAPRLALAYLGGAGLCTLVAMGGGGAAWWLFWPAVSLALLAACYAGLGPAGLQKQADGRFSPAATLLLLPYLAAAWINSRAWTRHHPAPDPITDGVWLGRMPTRRDMEAGPAAAPGANPGSRPNTLAFAALYDLSAELPAPGLGPWRYLNRPWLDLLPPTPEELRAAAAELASLHGQGPLLVCCALGYSRSAAALAAWLLLSGRAASAAAAVALLQARRPRLVLGPAHLAALVALEPCP